ncbi:MAG: hypothetical protein KGI24_08540 [Candidatus Omnitrophica bacterium]|nr:hypothetical protein [Candidatus Omnitrophota bacterium]MDE2214882.1 hypothetical protein [Candidatus Omnitrophota bacterium]MDE2230787.1 hypothetical protein [Candidatus Omnitrophota bacterium]
MKFKTLIIFIFGLLFTAGGSGAVFALQHTQKDGLFSMDVPAEWHWIEYPQGVIITYPDGRTMAMDIEMASNSKSFSQAEIKKNLKEADEKMITDGVKAHHGTLIDDKEITVDGVYATRLDFKTSPPNPITVAYIAFCHKGRAFTITYGSSDAERMLGLDDIAASFKFR